MGPESVPSRAVCERVADHLSREPLSLEAIVVWRESRRLSRRPRQTKAMSRNGGTLRLRVGVTARSVYRVHRFGSDCRRLQAFVMTVAFGLPD